MIRKLLALSLLSITCFFSAHAQTDPLYALYMNNPLVINPAYAGLNNNLNMTVGFRNQWAGFDGAPTTASFTAHTSIRDNKMGVGLVVVSDKLGEITNTQATANVSYKLKIDETTILSFGMQGGIQNYNTGTVYVLDKTDPLFAPVNQIKPIIGAGAILKSDKFMFGLSVPRLLNANFNVTGSAFTVYQQHYYLFGSYLFPLSERIILKPSILLKDTKGAPVSADINFNVNIDRNYTVGLYTRNFGAYGVLAQINFLNYYRIAYAFEVPTNNSVGTRYSTNEINLGIKLSVFSFHDRSTTNIW